MKHRQPIESPPMSEHHWKYRPSEHGEGIARDFEQQLKVTTETPAPSICVLRDGVWCHVVGPWVAEEMLRLSRLVPEPVVEGEHRWRFKVGSGAVDNFRAVKGQGFDYARVEILLQGGAWDIFVGQPVAEEMLRLATENESLGSIVGGQAQMISSIRQQLRIECGEIGDNSWPDDLHPSDVIEKYLAHPAAARIAELEARVAELEVEVAAKEATIHMAVARLGGEVEGAPTHRINFLQRIDELRGIERLREEDPLA